MASIIGESLYSSTKLSSADHYLKLYSRAVNVISHIRSDSDSIFFPKKEIFEIGNQHGRIPRNRGGEARTTDNDLSPGGHAPKQLTQVQMADTSSPND